MPEPVFTGEAPLIYRRRIRWGDADPALIVYTVRFLDYVMEGIEEWYRQVLGIDWYSLTVDRGMGSPVVSLQFDFAAPLKPGDELHLALTVDAVSRATLTFGFRGYREGRALSFSGSLTTCFVDSSGDQLRAVAIPEGYRRRIDAYREACG